MLDDRSYMRSSSYDRQRSVTFYLIVINIAIFVLQSALSFYKPDLYDAAIGRLALSPEGLAKGYVWQLLSFQFLHGGLLHLFGNLLGLYFFGNAVEEAIGRSRYLKLYLICGAVGGVLQALLGFLVPKYFGGLTVGASAGVLGMVATFATMFPDRQLTLLIFFVIPVSMRARTLLWISIGLSVFGILIPKVGVSVADGAHLGGIAAGWAFVTWFLNREGWSFPFPTIRRRRPSPPPQREYVSAPPFKKAFWQRPKGAEPEDLPTGDFISKEVDPILDKISAHGIQSLTERERKILEAARARMAKR